MKSKRPRLRKALMLMRATQHLHAAGLLLGKPAPVRLGAVLEAFSQHSPDAYASALAAARGNGKEKRWQTLVGLCEAIDCLPKPKIEEFKDFYISPAWRSVRYFALRRSNGRCQCCGASPETGAVLHVDHIKPKSKYPELALVLANLQVLCADCNMGKSNKDETDWRPKLELVVNQ